MFERPEDCSECRGTGAEGGSAGLATCTRCGGEGVIRKKAGFLTSRRDCMGCGGTGQIPRVRCRDLRRGGACRSRAALRGADSAGLDGRLHPARAAGRGTRAARRSVGRPARHHARAAAPVLRARGDARGGRADHRRCRSARRGHAGRGDRSARCSTGGCGCACRRGPSRGRCSACAARVSQRARPGVRGDAHVRVVVEVPSAVSDEARALLEQAGADAGRRGDAAPACVPDRGGSRTGRREDRRADQSGDV